MRITALLLPFVLLLAGCVTAQPRRSCGPRSQVTVRPTTPSPSPRAPEGRIRALYDGETGREIGLDRFLAKARDADLVAFGELHGQPVGAIYERLVYESLLTGQRPVALAMEFFERQHQPALDAYLAGEMDEEAFLKETQRNKAYPKTHAPLVELAKGHQMPVIAANSPRSLVSGYRKSKEEYYEDYLATLTEEERALLPAETSLVKDAYWERFSEAMGPKMAGPFFKAQSLWDDAMAESMARHRDANPDHRVFFVVGGFHVRNGLGTITKYRQRRPDDKVAILVMDFGEPPALAFDEEDRGAGDALLKVRPPERKERPSGPNPHARPKKAAKKPDPEAPKASDAPKP